ncbi:alpha/beta hydrolase [Phytoactinopolyspora halophila]|nr:alpha/beta fold hydrolase [Phytoactinopolyspora halophila]
MALYRGRMLRVLVVFLLIGGVVVAMLWWLQRELIYFPDAASVPAAGEVIEGTREVTLYTEDGLEFGAWFALAASGPAATDYRMAVLVAPGNGGNRPGRAGLAQELRRRGLAVLLMDYRGYGGNPGSPSEEGLARDAMAAVETLADLGYPAERTIYFGESLGSGVAAALQALRPPAGMVLWSPFSELADVESRHYPWLQVRLQLRDRFRVVEHLAGSEVPVTVVYGDRDSIAPQTSAHGWLTRRRRYPSEW